MERLFDTPAKRIAGWAFVVMTLLWVGWGIWQRGPAKASFELSDSQRAQLAAMPEEDYAEWLTKFYDRHATGTTPLQTLIIQRIPGEAPLVLATPLDSSDEEESTHWRCPWPAVTKALADPLEAPISARGLFNRIDYVHHLIPFDETGTRCVLVNQMQLASAGIGQSRIVAALLALFLAVLLVIAPRG